MRTGKDLKKFNGGNSHPRVGNEYQAKIPPLTIEFNCLQLVNGSVSSDAMTIDMSNNSLSSPHGKLDKVESRGLFPLNGSFSKIWTQTEQDSFLLGLYIFNRNFSNVKKFVGSKGMGDILSFYYGKFYKSEGYCRWAECRKSRDRKCLFGEKIFTGSQELKLLSRLYSRVSKDCQDLLIENHIKFSDGKLSFKDYVFVLKDIVGLNVFMEAVNINQGKQLQNLNSAINELTKNNNNNVSSVESGILLGKAYSSLTSDEIINFLRGDFKLSKAQCRSLFWGAVWPRLLASGWHIERIKNHHSLGLKHSSVFLVHGVPKFSKRLVKGSHYFDSVCDVLDKVASRPNILASNMKLAAELGETYGPNCNQDVMKYTVVDTSMLDEAELPKLKEFKSLLVQTRTSVDTSPTFFINYEQNTSQKSEDDAEEIENSNAAMLMIESGTNVVSSNCLHIILDNSMAKGPNPVMVAVKNHETQRTVPVDDNTDESLRTSPFEDRHQNSRKQDLSACNHEKSSRSIENISEERKRIEGDFNSSSVSSLAKRGGPDGRYKSIFVDILLEEEVTSIESSPQVVIDLNLPCTEPDLGTNLDTEQIQNNENSREKQALFNLNLPFVSPCFGLDTDMMNRSFISETEHSEQLNSPDTMASKEDQDNLNSRRQSRRSRMMTKRALESLEHELFSTKIRKKGVDSSQNNCVSASQVVLDNEAQKDTGEE